jgi:hypothetical protein
MIDRLKMLRRYAVEGMLMIGFAWLIINSILDRVHAFTP